MALSWTSAIPYVLCHAACRKVLEKLKACTFFYGTVIAQSIKIYLHSKTKHNKRPAYNTLTIKRNAKIEKKILKQLQDA